VCGLGQLFENEGFATTLVGFVREHVEKARPPRALWLDFPMGRPLGVPNDPEFQKRVLRAALGLLDAPRGPVLEDYAEEIPVVDGRMSYGLPAEIVSRPELRANPEKLLQEIQAEIAALRPEYEKAVEKHGRTTVGASGLEVEALAPFILSFLGGDKVRSPIKGLAPFAVLKLACEDLTAYYTEAASGARGILAFEELGHWFWSETHAAQAILALEALSDESDDPVLRQLIDHFLIVPRFWA